MKCDRCEGNGQAHGSDRPFESDGKGSYPGPCPKCGGWGQLPDANDLRNHRAIFWIGQERLMYLLKLWNVGQQFLRPVFKGVPP